MTASVETVELQDSSSVASVTDASVSSGGGLELPPVDRGKGAWLFVASATVLEGALWGFGFSYGVFQQALPNMEPFRGTSSLTIGVAGTVNLGLQYICMLFHINFFNRYPETLMWSSRIACVLCVASLVASSFATSVGTLILFQGVACGITSSVLYAPAVIWLYQWFAERRGLAAGIVFAGGTFGGAVFPLVLGKLLVAVGFANTMRIWAAFTAVTCGTALCFLKPRLPLPPKGAPRPNLIPRDLRFLRSRIFWGIVTTILTQSIAFVSVSLYLATFAVSLGYTPFLGQTALSVFNISAMAGQVVLGWLSDNRPYTFVMFSSTMLCGLMAFLLFGFASSIALVVVFAALFGAIGGGFAATWPVAATEVAEKNPQQAGLIFTLFGVAKGISAICGPIVAGALYNPSSVRSKYGQFGFTQMTIFVGSSMLASCFCSGATHMFRRKVK